MTLSKCRAAGRNLQHGLGELEGRMVESNRFKDISSLSSGGSPQGHSTNGASSIQQVLFSACMVLGAMNTKDKNLYPHGAHILAGRNK